MLWLAALVLAAAALAPMLAAVRRPAHKSERAPAIALYAAQLAELDREHDDNLIASDERHSARVEIQRRLLAAAGATADRPVAARHRWPIPAALAIVPLAALLLYLRVGSPSLPAAPLAARLAHDRTVVAVLTERLPGLAGDSASLWQAEILLGSAESDMQNWPAAVAAWKAALAIHFDATLAAQAAEAETEAHGAVTPDAASLYRAALAAAPANAPWRAAVEARLDQGELP